ncbi:MAG TPA: DegT/DnrJ/EryC1/StrS family aminotransferase [Patescibacteria group bacterium]|nr:DegT/DnrJ/EryC1/StrS family aminotransferase [Patescibacteria group bacterium]
MTVGTRRAIPVARPDLSGREAEYVAEAVASSWISSTGPFVTRFEREFAEWCGTRHAVAAANGTVAIHLALVALGVAAGDEVIVPSLTYIATANAVRYAGATPIFVDVDPATWCLDTDAVEQAVTPRTKGIIAVDLYGHPADMDALAAIAKRHGLWLVEDAAEAHGARYRGRPAGSLGTIGTFSFYGNKIMTSGEGGALTLDDDHLDQLVRLYRGQGVDPNRRYWFSVVGYNYRLTNVACALLCAQLERADELIAGRQRVFDGYAAALAGIDGIGFQPVAAWAQPAPWLYCITVDERAFGRSRDELMTALVESGVETRPFFHPIHLLPPYAPDTGAPPTLPVTEALAAGGMNLPTSPQMTEADVEQVADAIRAARR